MVIRSTNVDEQALMAYYEAKKTELRASLDIDVGEERIDLGNNKSFLDESCIAKYHFCSNQLSVVEEVLSKLSAGTFRLCSDCEQPIEPDRLNVMFETGKPIKYCFGCQELHDKGGKLIPFRK